MGKDCEIMNEKQLTFLNSIEDIDWSSKKTALLQRANANRGISSVVKLSRGQKKRAKKKLKTVNSAIFKPVETVVFHNPDTRPSQSSKVSQKTQKEDQPSHESVEIDLKKARFEVMKFGLNSLKSTEKFDAETALAVSLGAKPEKHKYVNYKELVVTRKAEIAKQKEDEREEKLKAKPKSKKKKILRKSNSASAGVLKVKPPGANAAKAKRQSKQRRPT